MYLTELEDKTEQREVWRQRQVQDYLDISRFGDLKRMMLGVLRWQTKRKKNGLRLGHKEIIQV